MIALRAHRIRRSALLSGAGWLTLLGALLHPAHGMGVQICVYRRMLGVECPGCGLTRSVSCAARGMWHESVSYHPLGIAVLLLAACLALWPLTPRPWRTSAASWARQRRWLGPTATLAAAWALASVAMLRLLA
ncbi:MAG: DUF2752 domain-containing protein [Phycisphaerales bacterium JB039]